MNNEKLKTEFEIVVKGKDLNDLLDKFKLINPTHYLLFKNKNQRNALERLVIQFGYDKVSKMIEICAQTNGQDYAPTITTPMELEKKLGSLLTFYKRQQAKKPKIF